MARLSTAPAILQGRSAALRLGLALALGTRLALPQADVLTQNYDLARTNANLQETILTTQNVRPGRFGKLLSRKVDGFIYAQPLYVGGLDLGSRGKHNVVLVATMHNSVYAFDADLPAANEPLWKVNLGPSLPSSVWPDFADVLPEVGILSTPVIDRESRTVYLVCLTYTGSQPTYWLHALDLLTGTGKKPGPVRIQARTPGTGTGGDGTTVTFDPAQHLQRPGLLLLRGQLYLAFGSHGDAGEYHGWLMVYEAASFRQAHVLNLSPNGQGSSVWQGGRAPAADEEGYVYFSTGNGDYNGGPNYGECLLKMNPQRRFDIEAVFAPFDWLDMNQQDGDFGSAGPLLIPRTDLVLGGSKSANIYVLHRDRLDDGTGDGLPAQTFQLGYFGLYNMALWNRTDGPVLFSRAAGQRVQGFLLMEGGVFQTQPFGDEDAVSPVSFDGMAVSANQSLDGSGIVWLTAASRRGLSAPGVLRAFHAGDLSQELWNSSLNSDRDALGTFAKFASPTVANGKVYVPTFSNQLVVYGLLDSAPGLHAVRNAASGAPASLAAGALITLEGVGLGPENAPPAELTSSAASAAGATQVWVDGFPATVLSSSPNRVDVLVPDQIDARRQATVRVAYQGFSDSLMLPVGASPGLFTADQTGAGQAVAFNEDGMPNDREHPAKPGALVTVFATGLATSAQSNAQPGGSRQDSRQAAVPEVSATIDGKPAKVIAVQPVPAYPQGVQQITLRVPADAASSIADVVTVQVEGVRSQTNAFLSIQAAAVP